MHQQMVYLLVQLTNFDFCLQVDLIIVFGPQAVFSLLAVLAHHDNWRLNGGEAGEDEIEKNVRIRIKGLFQKKPGIDRHPDNQNRHKY